MDGYGCPALERKGVASASEGWNRMRIHKGDPDRQKGRGSEMVFCRLQIHVQSLKCS
jgi:hypothetical protein